jgi:diguanylate cyclase (GGDEF)-like protein/PAS domain S-box-containing protein
MADRIELMEAALDVYPEGLALLDQEEHVVLWNRAAEWLTGFPGAELIGQTLPASLEALVRGGECARIGPPGNGAQSGCGALVHAQHKLGRDVPAMARRVILRDGLGARIGVAAAFHAAQLSNALPHGESSEVEEVQQSCQELQDRLENEFEMYSREGVPLGVLWITVDQARELRRTHGARASETMLEKVERTLANGLRPGEEVGRWGEDEFLVLSHESSADALQSHAKLLAGLARTADFRWWGDRVSLSVSLGAALAQPDESLAGLLERAGAAMQESAQSGGNHVTIANRRLPCSQS